jgi:NAD(P)-dependent dehydrogenase (short-subunit alcohol dehydrogenase family)
MPIEVFRRQLEINLVGQLAMTQAVLPALRQSQESGGDARIVMIGSIGGRIGGPMLGAYHAAKFGLVGLSDSLRAELAPFGIRVILIEPGAVATPIWKRGTDAANALIEQLPPEGVERYAKQIAAVRTTSARSAARGLAPDRAAAAIVKALTTPNPKPRQVVGRDAQIGAAFARLLPTRLIYRMIASRAR